MGIALPEVNSVQVDNRQIISFKYGTCAKSKLRGMISRRWDWVEELLEEGIDIVKVDTRSNLADILTKCLSNLEYNRQRRQIITQTSRLGGNRES